MNQRQVKRELLDAAAGGIAAYLDSTRGARLAATVVRPSDERIDLTGVRVDDSEDPLCLEIKIYRKD